MRDFKRTVLLVGLLSLTACGGDTASPKMAKGHEGHKQQAESGHEAVRMGDEVVYKHDGELHTANGDVVVAAQESNEAELTQKSGPHEGRIDFMLDDEGELVQ